ncbi:hypothetical protein ABPG72_000224 [Tetrahymena utriculariae]
MTTFENKKKNLDWVMGIDEAGRGPVLGPMVYGCCVWPISYEPELKLEGFNDSKQLSEQKRDQLYARMEELKNDKLYFEVRILNAEFLSNRMLAKNRDSLNELSFNAAYSLIDSVMGQGFNVTQVFLDTVGKEETYQARLYQDYKYTYPQLKFTVSSKADAKFPVVGAASICAKVTRDLQITNNDMREPLDLSKATGSGYPSDPNTKKWLQDVFDPVFGFPSNVRYSWSTVDNIFNEKKLQVNFFDENEKKDKSQKSLTQMVSQKKCETNGYYTKKIGITRNFDL